VYLRHVWLLPPHHFLSAFMAASGCNLEDFLDSSGSDVLIGYLL